MFNINVTKDYLVLFFIKERGFSPDQAADYVNEFPRAAFFTYREFMKDSKVEPDRLKDSKE